MTNYRTNELLENVLSKFPNARRNSSGQWEAQCPVHGDKKPSLSIRIGEKGSVICHCHKGCKLSDILAAVGLRMRDLFLPPSKDAGVVEEYPYQDFDGTVVSKTIRRSPKKFYQQSPDGKGGWRDSIQGCKKVPYRLPELLAADVTQPVFIAEGEKDVDRVRSLGLIATCNAMGACKWSDELSSYLRDRHVVIFPDNDSTGQDHAQQVATSLCGIAASIKVVQLPDLAAKGDVSDWLDAGGTKDGLLRLVDSAGHWTLAANIDAPLDGLVCLADIQSKKVEWLWPGRIPLGKLTLLSGNPGLGKSFVSLSTAAAVSNGSPWPDDPTTRQPKGDIILLSAEDNIEDTIKPRLEAHNADCKRIKALLRLTNLSDDIERLRKAIDQTTNCRLIVIDPISAYLGKIDSNNNAEVRGLLSPLSDLAAEKQVAILLINHLRKSGEGPAIHRSMGSLGFVAAVRTAWLICEDNRDRERRYMLCLKNNLARDSANGLAYRVESDSPEQPAMIRWEASPITMSADEALAIHFSPRKHSDNHESSEDQLCAWIHKRGDRVTVRELQQGNRQFSTAQDAEAALNKLATLGRGRWECGAPNAKGGRPSRVFVLANVSTSTEPAETPLV